MSNSILSFNRPVTSFAAPLSGVTQRRQGALCNSLRKACKGGQKTEVSLHLVSWTMYPFRRKIFDEIERNRAIL